MSNVKCSQCEYFNDKSVKNQCTRYCIPMNKESICVDCEEIDNITEYQVAADILEIAGAFRKYSLS